MNWPLRRPLSLVLREDCHLGALHFAVEYKDLSSVATLLAAGADPYTANEDGVRNKNKASVLLPLPPLQLLLVLASSILDLF